MKRGRCLITECENENNVNIKKSERTIDKENKMKHTIWCLVQGQKNLEKITKEYCALCNTKIIKKNNNEVTKKTSKCSYCSKCTCNNPECGLVTCNMCESHICSLCASYCYESNIFNSIVTCPNCNL
ncbi:hypothetical protein FG386_001682 [Cryptosporidium ryanae]|uniref:uncharacterized protein n=1 Tax=Cryptosporidium ryanae TaxID=515981 RepID=UPI00351A53D4|nr:hypothetical protein FG386_001682 [Cryptosporidium ryanae]